MTYEVIIKPSAEIDITEIAKWYESKSQGLGFRFLEAMDLKTHFLEQNPNQYQIRYKNIRFVLIEPFPYAIHFTTESQKVYIHAVLSTDRDPKIWKH